MNWNKLCRFLPTWPTFVGSIVMLAGAVPGVLWILNYIDYIRPGEKPEEWPVIVMSFALLGLGGMVAGGKGETIGEAITWWFRRRAPYVADDENEEEG